MLKIVCKHCDTELTEGARLCDRCGAPSSQFALEAHQAREGYSLFHNLWRGFTVEYPQGWSIDESSSTGVTFRSAQGDGLMIFGTLEPNPSVNALQQAELLVQTLPVEEFCLLDGSNVGQARVAFRGPECEGLASVSCTPQGGSLGLVRHRPGASYDTQKLLQDLLGSVQAAASVPTTPWVDPNEGSFRTVLPQGWRGQAQVKMTQTGRMPSFVTYAESTGKAFLAWDPEFRMFINQELPPEPAADEGFFGMLGRMAKKVEHSLVSAAGEVICPFRGLKPVVEQFFLPHWKKTLPGCRLISVTEHGPKKNIADVRLQLPGDLIRVFRLEGDHVPDTTGLMPNRWYAGHAYFFQAPAALIPQLEPLFRGVAESYEANPQWQANEQRRVAQQNALRQQQMNQMAQQHAMRMQQQNAMFQQTQAAFMDASNTALDGSMASWNHQQQSSDYLSHQMSNCIHETSDFVNTDTNTVYNLPIHNDHYWDTNQDVVVGSDQHFNTPVGWTKLEEIKGY